MHRPQWSLLVATILAVALAGGAAVAEPTSDCEVLTILASKQKTTRISPALTRFQSTFTQPPFNRFNGFELVRTEKLRLTAGSPVKLKLASKLTGSLELNERVANKLKLTLTLARAGASPATIAAESSPGTPFFTAGFKNEKGTWIVGIICNGS